MGLDLILPLAAIALFFIAVFALLGWYFVTMHSGSKKGRQRRIRC